MRSFAARLGLGLAACLALGAAAVFLFTSQQRLDERRSVIQSFDRDARQATYTLAELRTAQQAYVAAGQGVGVWAPKVGALTDSASKTLDLLRADATTSAGRGVLLEATSNIAKFQDVDRRIQDYLADGQRLMASDVLFVEGAETLQASIREVEAAMLAEHQAVALDQASVRRLQIYVGGGTAVLSMLIIGWLAFRRSSYPRSQETPAPDEAPADDLDLLVDADALRLRDTAEDQSVTPPSSPAGQAPARPSSSALRIAADLCTDFGCVREATDLDGLLARAATLIDAGGLIVWVGNHRGGDLQPVVAHGYSQDALRRMPAVPASARNATAEAYRSGRLQIVLSRPGVSPGAIVAPLIGTQGCFGVLTAEITEGSETSDDVQALATIIASQLALVLAPVEDVDDQDRQVVGGG